MEAGWDWNAMKSYLIASSSLSDFISFECDNCLIWHSFNAPMKKNENHENSVFVVFTQRQCRYRSNCVWLYVPLMYLLIQLVVALLFGIFCVLFSLSHHNRFILYCLPARPFFPISEVFRIVFTWAMCRTHFPRKIDQKKKERVID